MKYSIFLHPNQKSHYVASLEDPLKPVISNLRRKTLTELKLYPGDILTQEEVDNFSTLGPRETAPFTRFYNQEAQFPTSRFFLADNYASPTTRIVDLITPVGRGQRGIIVAPPRSGKTTVLHELAKGLLSIPDSNNEVIILLVDERPEEVGEFKKIVKDYKNVRVWSSTFDQKPTNHVQIVQCAMDYATRQAELGKDVTLLVDSLTRLSRASNVMCPGNGRTLSGGLDINAVQFPKKFFGMARQLEQGGSVTILATLLVDTGSKMDEVIHEEFKGTSNWELVLDRVLADKRVFPAVHITLSGVRREEKMRDPDEMSRVVTFRDSLNKLGLMDGHKYIASSIAASANNIQLLLKYN